FDGEPLVLIAGLRLGRAGQRLGVELADAEYGQHHVGQHQSGDLQAGELGAVELGKAPVAEAEHGSVHAPGHVQVLGAEDHPADHHQQEGEGPFQRVECARGGVHAQGAFDGQPGAVPGAPDDVGEVGAVPQTAQEHGEEQVAVSLESAATVAAQADVQVVPQPGGQADVPAPTELGDGLADVRLVEVLHEAEA